MQSAALDDLSDLKQEINDVCQTIEDIKLQINSLLDKIVEIKSTLSKFESVDDKSFILEMLNKYADITGKYDDGLKAITFANIVEVESKGKINSNKVKEIMSSLSTSDKGVCSYKQEIMYYFPHYRGMKLKWCYRNLPENKDDLYKIIK
jgi:hypothetical protein